MYEAELKGKLPSKVERQEDILTSDVFSFFKYADRSTYLRALFQHLGLSAEETVLEEAEFHFWPHYEDGTEPDIVIVAGEYYVLFEAKYGAPLDVRQIERECRNGRKEAARLGKRFCLVAVTADYCFDETELCGLSEECRRATRWANWQTVARILLELLEEKGRRLPDLLFARDLYSLLEKKGLRAFRSFGRMKIRPVDPLGESLFLRREKVILRGEFIGFKSLEDAPSVGSVPRMLYYQKTLFDQLHAACIKRVPHVFLREENNGSSRRAD